MENQEYGTFIYMDKDLREKIKNMPEEEINLFSSIIAYNLNNTMREINDDFLKR